MKRLAVVLFNLGGPLGPRDVKGFLYNLFRDKYIINLPAGLRHAVAGLIATTREKSARANYAYMGGGSPIVKQTEAQAEALRQRLQADMPESEVRVFIGMRYWHPFIETTAAEVAAFAPDDVVLLPLYPQFSSTTTLSAFAAFDKAYSGASGGPGVVHRVCCYADNDHFIQAHSDAIAEKLRLLKDLGQYRLLFSAHGLPESIIARGDPYQDQIEACVARIMARLSIKIDHVICYQSRVGRLKWIEPSTIDAITAAGRDGKSVIVVPIAFVSEHIETLVELDIEYAYLAGAVGVRGFIRVPALGIDAGYIAALAEETHKALATTDIVGDHDCAACYSFCPKRKAA